VPDWFRGGAGVVQTGARLVQPAGVQKSLTFITQKVSEAERSSSETLNLKLSILK